MLNLLLKLIKMNNNRNIIFGIGIIISFALLIASISMYFNYQQEEREKGHLSTEMINVMSKNEIINYMEHRHDTEPTFYGYHLLPFIGFIGVLVGTFVFYIMSDLVVQQRKNMKKSSRTFLRILTNDERKVIEKLMENNGKIQQYELTHLPGLNKVKTTYQ